MLIAASRIIPASRGRRGAAAILAPGYVASEAGKITAIGAGPPPRRPDVELTEGFLVPGFVDLQVNGYFGVELGAADASGWATVSRRLPETGTTAFLPTFITAPVEVTIAALRRAAGFAPALAAPGLAAAPAQAARGPAARGPADFGPAARGPADFGPAARGPADFGPAARGPGARGPAAPGRADSGRPGARVLGVHLEGPFIARSRRGAHNPAWIRTPDPATIDALLAAGSGLVRLVTLAPEVDGAMAAIKQLTGAGVVVSVGHSDATARQVSAAAMYGAAMVTHLFNAQRGLYHREPGVVGQALADNRLTSSLIADLHHVSGQVAALAFRAAPGRICLVTDAASCAGMPQGRYVLGGEPIELAEGDGTPPVRADGTLAGSALRMDSAVANMVALGIGLPDAVAAATRIPADLIGRTDLGAIAPAAAADLTWLSDDLRSVATWVAGRQVWGPALGLARARGQKAHNASRSAKRTEFAVDSATESHQPATHMRTEILEQPAALRATIAALLPRVAEVATLARRARQVLFFARGTSDNAAVYGTYLIQTRTGRLASLGSPSVATAYRSRIDLSGVLAVGLSQSGRTQEIVETLAWARDCGAAVVGITNAAGSPLAEMADVALVTEAGVERAVPATKTFTCQLAALAVLALGLGAELNAGWLERLPVVIEDLLDLATAPGYGIGEVVAELAGVDGLVVSARGLAYSTALEVALKIKEACYLHAMGISYADLQHGPIAVVDARTPAIIIAADSGPTLDAAVGLARRVIGAGARAYAIGGGGELAAVSSRSLAGPALPEWLAPIGLIVPGQLLTEELSRRLGIDPDSPRGLSKVTQTN